MLHGYYKYSVEKPLADVCPFYGVWEWIKLKLIKSVDDQLDVYLVYTDIDGNWKTYISQV